MLALAPRLRRAGDRGASSEGRRPTVTPTALAVLAFAVTSAFALSVLGGLLGFIARDDHPVSPELAQLSGTYVMLASTAVVLLLVPLAALGGAAARLGVARRDARLATLRLLGVTPREVVALTLVETAWQGLAGAALGVAGYGLLLPLWTRIPFQGQPFSASELWVGWVPLVCTLVAVPALAAVSGAVSLRRVVVSPLGVSRRTTPPGMHGVRALVVVVAVAGFVVVSQSVGMLGPAIGLLVLLGALAAVFGTLNLVGPWTLSVLGRVMARTARTPATLLAARRLLDDPRGAWRVVGGLGLASFVAGVLSVLPGLAATDTTGDPAGAILVRDLVTGGLLTLGIAFTVAATSAGIMAAATVLDRRREYALQRLAGVPVELFDAVRRREVIVPMVFVSGTSVAVALVVLLPLVGVAGALDPTGLLALAACLLVGGALVVGATETSRPLLRAVLQETVVRAD
ncbi:MAG: hypothetical protein HGA44_17765 [Cellulomonadaceae bacterium]|nr:hypothetical protein [Cellulomonadaceae bacterium]